MRTTTTILSVVLALAGCASPPPSARRAPSADLDAYCAVAGHAGLDSWVGDVVTLCAPAEDDHSAACRGMRVGPAGALEPIVLPAGVEALRVLPAGDALVVSALDGRLLLVRDGAIERELATQAIDAWIDEAGERVVFVAPTEGELELGVPTVIAAVELASGARTVLVDDAEASTPRPIPGTRDVLFVSTRDGLASLHVVREGGAVERITHEGLTEWTQDAVPVPERELAFVGGTLVFAAELDAGPQLWSLDLETREVRALGEGSWPRAHGPGEVVALQQRESCAAVIPVGGAR